MTADGTWTAVLILAFLNALALLMLVGAAVADVQRTNRRKS